MGDYFLKPGESIGPGQVLVRAGAKLFINHEGNLVCSLNGKDRWSTGTKGATSLVMQSDGNLVLKAGAQPLWTSKTQGRPGSQVNLDTSGQFIIYRPSGGGKFLPLWASGSHDRREGIVRGPSHGSLLPDPMIVVKSLGHAVTDAAHLKISRSVKDLGRGVNQITGSQIIQAAFPVVAPANIVNGAVTGGKSGAIKAAQSFLKNPIAKATYTAVGVVFPPIAPVTAGAVAGMEAASRLIDGLESKDPRMIASAALQLASTQLLAHDGIPGAQRALEYIDKTGKARGIAELIGKGDGAAIAAANELKKQAASGDPKAAAAHHLLSAVLFRQSGKTPQKPAIHAAGKSNAPTLLAQVHAAQNSPHGLRIGDFTVLRTGRLLHRGKALAHKRQHKTGKAVAHHLPVKKTVPHNAHLPR